MGLVSLLASLWFPLGVNTLPPLLLLLSLPVRRAGRWGWGRPSGCISSCASPTPSPLRTDRRFLAALYRLLPGRGLPGHGRILLRSGTLGRPGSRGSCGCWIRPPVAALFAAFAPLAALAGLALFWAGTRAAHPQAPGAVPGAAAHLPGPGRPAPVPLLLLPVAGRSLAFARGSWVFYAPLPLLPLSFAFAIFRQGFFDVRRAILRWVSYFIVLGLILAGYLGGLAFLFGEGMQVVPAGWAGVLAGLAALPIGWLLRYLLQALRRIFRRDLNTARETILGSLRETRKRFSEEAILEGLAESLRPPSGPTCCCSCRRTAAASGCRRCPADPDVARRTARPGARPMRCGCPRACCATPGRTGSWCWACRATRRTGSGSRGRRCGPTWTPWRPRCWP